MNIFKHHAKIEKLIEKIDSGRENQINNAKELIESHLKKAFHEDNLLKGLAKQIHAYEQHVHDSMIDLAKKDISSRKNAIRSLLRADDDIRVIRTLFKKIITEEQEME